MQAWSRSRAASARARRVGHEGSLVPIRARISKRTGRRGPPGVVTLELDGQVLEGAHQQAGVHAHRHEQAAQFQVAPRQRPVGVENPGGLASPANARDGVLDGRLHVRVRRVAPVTQGGAQVRRPDEDAVDAVHGGDLVQVVQGLGALDLYQQTHFAVRLVQIAGHAVPARCPGQGAAHAAHAVRRVAHGAHQLAGLIGAVHHGHQQGLGADVQVLLDQGGVAHRRAQHRLGRVGRHRLELRQQGAQVVGGVFTVHQQPVEAGVGGQLGAVGVAQPQPQADSGRPSARACLKVLTGMSIR